MNRSVHAGPSSANVCDPVNISATRGRCWSVCRKVSRNAAPHPASSVTCKRSYSSRHNRTRIPAGKRVPRRRASRRTRRTAARSTAAADSGSTVTRRRFNPWLTARVRYRNSVPSLPSSAGFWQSTAAGAKSGPSSRGNWLSKLVFPIRRGPCRSIVGEADVPSKSASIFRATLRRPVKICDRVSSISATALPKTNGLGISRAASAWEASVFDSSSSNRRHSSATLRSRGVRYHCEATRLFRNASVEASARFQGLRFPVRTLQIDRLTNISGYFVE